MQFKIRCVCGQCYEGRSEFAGKLMRCRQCQQVFTIPQPRNRKWVHREVYEGKVDQEIKAAVQFSTGKPSDAFDAAVSRAGIPQAGTWEDKQDYLDERALNEQRGAKTVAVHQDSTEAYGSREHLRGTN
ncbi:MAG: hypothetical protein QF437_06380 [Planctomycetota bacterium]|nr:hypothetical protein [Planctomycetota bacterium]MDP7130096.1 hypothetical protein [Planctomycetota bacterium]MDP7252853.1 hypothetical protein [Planctomycetota bacterium]